MQRRILLTGSNGLLGQKILSLLTDRPGTRLLATSRGVNRHPEREGYQYQAADLTDFQALDAIFAAFKPTDLIHTAAITQVDRCESERKACDAANVEAVAHLVKRCGKYKTHMVHISTDFVFDGAAGPYREGDQPAPVNYYGQSKLKAEQIIQESGIPAAILRTMLLYGVSPAMSRSNIVLWVKASLEAGKSIKVVEDQVRCPTLAEDLAKASVAAMMKRVEGLFHISGSESMSILELAYRVAHYWKLDSSLIEPIKSDSLNQAAMRPPVTGFIILKAQTELGYQPQSLAHGLALVDRQLQEL